MSHTHEHLEHAEHDGHHAAGPFDRRVAVTMAIIAAVLAGLSMIGHRTHNEVLRLQGDANRLRTEAAAATVRESDKYAWYQSKRNRQTQYETAIALAAMLPNGSGTRDRDGVVEKWRKKVQEYDTDPKERLGNILDEAAAAGKEAAGLMAAAERQKADAGHAHHQTNRLDIAHLLAEVALVVCSLALLTKRRAFWVGGVLAAAAALAVAGSAYTIPHEDHHADPAHPPGAAEKLGGHPAVPHSGTPAGKGDGEGH